MVCVFYFLRRNRVKQLLRVVAIMLLDNYDTSIIINSLFLDSVFVDIIKVDDFSNVSFL